MSGAEAKAFVAQSGARPAAYLLDPRGVVGKVYDAKTTPHMYVVNKAGTLVYAGAKARIEVTFGVDASCLLEWAEGLEQAVAIPH